MPAKNKGVAKKLLVELLGIIDQQKELKAKAKDLSSRIAILLTPGLYLLGNFSINIADTGNINIQPVEEDLDNEEDSPS